MTDFRIDKSDGNLLLLLARMLEDNLVVWMILSLGINSLSLDMDLKVTISKKVCCCWIVVGNNFIISKLNPYNAISGKGNAFWQTYLEKSLLKIDICLYYP